MIPGSEYLRVARITGSHALDGKLRIYIVSDIPGRFDKGRVLYLEKGKSYSPRTVEYFRVIKGKVGLLKLEGVDDRNSADLLKGSELFIEKDEAEKARSEFDDSTFFYHDLIGCIVHLEGAEYGDVEDIMEAGSGEILVIRNRDQQQVLVPFVDSMVNTERVSEGIIEINPAEGLLDF